MKVLTISVLMLAVGFGLGYVFLSQDQPASAASAPAKQLYTCGMHPEIISDEPGYCPICGMKLIPKRDNASGGAVAAGAIQIDPTTTQNMGLVTAAVSKRTITRNLRAFGKVDYDEANIYTVNLKVDGWVEKLYVDETGDQVKKGQPLLEIYSPKLVAAQKEYLVAYDQAKSSDSSNMDNLLRAARQRLLNWDISDDQIERLVNTGEVNRTMIIRSPIDGIVIEKHFNEGEQLKPGTKLYEIADLSSVWVVAYVYEQDLPFVSVGQTAEIDFPNLPGKSYTAKIIYVSPFLDLKRQAEIRLELPNPHDELKPEMYAEVTLESSSPTAELAIPRKAVINSGVRQLVYVADGNDAYSPRIIKTGAVGSNDMIAVHSGLHEGEKVITSGQFLLDSESRLNEALAKGDEMGHQHGGGGMEHQNDSNQMKPMHDSTQMQHQHDSSSISKNMNMSASNTDTTLSGIYTCPMPQDYDVLQYGPGKCPKCGMALVPVEETANHEVYYCPMTEDSVVQNKPGRCPKCGMKLVKLEVNQPTPQQMDSSSHRHEMHKSEMKSDKEESVITGGHDIYTCPMPSHYNVLQYGPGKCSECGMALVPLAETDNKEVYVCPMTSCGTVQDHPGTCPVCGMNLVRYQPE
jgi:membrane fusion protein, copper/silver efflux system